VPLSDPRIALVVSPARLERRLGVSGASSALPVPAQVADSNVKPQLSGSEYPDRVQQCKDACAAMQADDAPPSSASRLPSSLLLSPPASRLRPAP